ncbi:MAG TPA: hypothetical protein VLK35_02175 [Methylomirabilota bacterium]|nr:hypothetical protein [Methylomirabilota bacterium]
MIDRYRAWRRRRALASIRFALAFLVGPRWLAVTDDDIEAALAQRWRPGEAWTLQEAQRDLWRLWRWVESAAIDDEAQRAAEEERKAVAPAWLVQRYRAVAEALRAAGVVH